MRKKTMTCIAVVLVVALGSYVQAQSCNCGPTVVGQPMYGYSQPVYSQPMSMAPAYSSPAYSSPAYSSPAYSSPAYSTSVCSTPAYSTSVCAQPMTYSTPLTSGCCGYNMTSNVAYYQPAYSGSMMMSSPVTYSGMVISNDCVGCGGSGVIYGSPATSGETVISESGAAMDESGGQSVISQPNSSENVSPPVPTPDDSAGEADGAASNEDT